MVFIFSPSQMLAKKNRLTGADVQFLLRKGKKIHGNWLSFASYTQYSNRSYSQLSVQIPVKVDKRSTMRNLLKRIASDVGGELIVLGQHAAYFKIFAFVSKQAIERLKELIATDKKTTITQQRQEMCRQDFTFLADRLGKP